MNTMLGSVVNKPSKILIKILNIREYIKLNTQNIHAPKLMILSYSVD